MKVVISNARKKNIRANTSSLTERKKTIRLIKEIGEVIKKNNNVVISKENRMEIKRNIINNQRTKTLVHVASKNNTCVSLQEITY